MPSWSSLNVFIFYNVVPAVIVGMSSSTSAAALLDVVQPKKNLSDL